NLEKIVLLRVSREPEKRNDHQPHQNIVGEARTRPGSVFSLLVEHHQEARNGKEEVEKDARVKTFLLAVRRNRSKPPLPPGGNQDRRHQPDLKRNAKRRRRRSEAKPGFQLQGGEQMRE